MILRLVQILCFLMVLWLGYISYEQALKEIERIELGQTQTWDGK